MTTVPAILLSLSFIAAGAPFAEAQKGAAPNPDMQAVLDELASLNPKPVETLKPEDARKQPNISEAAVKLMAKKGLKPEPVGHISNEKVPVGDHKIAVRIYAPKGEGPFPVIFYIHGGGWVLATLDTYDASCRALCNLTGAVVISTDYTHAPEGRFPVAHEDVLATYQWALANAGNYKGDAKKIAVVGESAGGNMAAALCMMAKEKGIMEPIYEVLVYPVADLTTMDTPSYQENAEAKPLNKPMMKWFAGYYLNSPADAKNPKLSILKAGGALAGLPPTTVICDQIDPLRSEGEALAKAIETKGVKVHEKTFMGVTHEFFGLGALVIAAKEAEMMAGDDLNKAFGK